ncbi:MAG: extracellular solute-binding protein [Lachnospiraceae bacterium]|nr:extracellular solute-binding protein [Lachnospiraceae bacterium]
MKKTRKKWLALLLSLAVFAGCFTGCGSQQETPTDPAPSSGNSEVKETETEGKSADPVTITVLTTRHNEATNDASDLWFFKYMEYWFAEQGYNVTIEVQQTMEEDQQIPLLLGTDSLPDVIWGPKLSETNTVQYGVEEGIVLDWTPYLNTEYMPNITAQFETYPELMTACTAPDGAVYALPYIKPNQYGSGTYGISERLYIRQSWLDACGLEEPTTQEELLDMLRAFKQNITLADGQEVIPLVSTDDFFEKYLWVGLGYYGTEPKKYGTNLMIKDGQVELPAYTEDYREFIEIMKTCYDEGLISADHFTMDGTTARGLMGAGVCGALCYWTLGDVKDFEDIICANPILLGDNDEIYVSKLSTYEAGRVWASADTEHPELVAMLVDFIYSDEGAFVYRNGPEQGKDPLNMLDGWYYDEKGVITTKQVADGNYDNMTVYARQYVYPYDSAGLRPVTVTTGTGEIISYTDAVTGETVSTIYNEEYSHETNDGHWRLITIEKWNPVATSVRLPEAYLNVDDSARASDLKTILVEHITAESAKFITGVRSLDEIDEFWKELESLGVEEYVELYRDAYSGYMDAIFK